MANQDETEITCKCQYTLGESAPKTKDSFNNTFNIHEIDEEESETEETRTLEQPDSTPEEEDDKVAEKTEDASDDETAYTGESFCSNESCDESDVTNVTSGSLNSSSLLCVANLQRGQNSKKQNAGVNELTWKNDHKDEFYSLSDEPSRAVTPDNRFIKPRRYRRWNMSFTDEEMRRIERENELLLRKIMTQQKPRHKVLDERIVQPRVSSSAINRKKLQKKIEDDNMLLLRRIQQAKSSVFTDASKMGCRLTFL